jgi:hypothetical protein
MSIELFLNASKGTIPSTLCSLFQAAARDTWERIAFSRWTPGLKIHETTITQNLVYEMNLLKQKLNLDALSIYESRNERTNGHDLEIVVRQRDEWFTYWIQSKILYHSIRRKNHIRLDDGVYRQFPHKVGRRTQVDILLRRARDEGAIPLYLLYNFVTAPFSSPSLCGLDMDRSQYGCSLVGAHLLKDEFSESGGNLRSTVRFSELHPETALPWSVLACCLPQYDLADTLRLFRIPDGNNVRPLANEPLSHRQWALLNQYASNPRDDFRLSSEKILGFSPRYRIVINSNQIG